MPSTVRFGRWFPADERPELPDLPAVVQCRIASGLMPYPTGQSAMVWYGAGTSARALVADAVARFDDGFFGQDVVFRFRPSDAPEQEVRGLLARFVERFGAPPAGQAPDHAKSGPTR